MLRIFLKTLRPLISTKIRAVGGVGDGGAVGKEQQLAAALRRALPGITYLSVEDISGGCGAMFEVSVEAKEFAGLSRVKQHRLVTESLKDEIAEMHGIRIHTTPPTSPE
ncbi:PREDICTED: bolA-like protein 3 [Papilio xuthus]|uniref:BolA-like protein 3 n=1 Tax=Papilio xuthus TaxID=66420 RepID=A0A194PCT0_PAPXU|nr:PREDICTED: bolA-like protein 3 [Papilio xuthus]KPI91027.1 BolA-like protein 3 [Papilio xuthus]